MEALLQVSLELYHEKLRPRQIALVSKHHNDSFVNCGPLFDHLNPGGDHFDRLFIREIAHDDEALHVPVNLIRGAPHIVSLNVVLFVQKAHSR